MITTADPVLFCLECRKVVTKLVSLRTTNGKGFRRCCEACKARITKVRNGGKIPAKSLETKGDVTTIETAAT